MGYRQMDSDVFRTIGQPRNRKKTLPHNGLTKGPFCMKSNGTLPSIPHPNRVQALKKARLTAGFPNIVNGQRINSSRRIKISDPVTGEELASVTDTQKDGLDQAIQSAKAAFPSWSSKTWNERKEILAKAMEELKAHTDELCTI